MKRLIATAVVLAITLEASLAFATDSKGAGLRGSSDVTNEGISDLTRSADCDRK
jgi:hypothetical protein